MVIEDKHESTVTYTSEGNIDKFSPMNIQGTRHPLSLQASDRINKTLKIDLS